MLRFLEDPASTGGRRPSEGDPKEEASEMGKRCIERDSEAALAVGKRPIEEYPEAENPWNCRELKR